MDILIAGAGIGGLAAALSLHAAGFRSIRVLESAAQIDPLGVGLNLLPNACRELQELGVLDELIAGSIQTRELVFCNWHGNRVWQEPRGRFAGHGWPQLSIHRGFLQKVLAAEVRKRLGEDAIATDSRVKGFLVKADGRVEAEVEHRVAGRQERLTADVLVGADGIRSAVRAQLYPEEGATCWNGLMMWRGTAWAKPYLSGASMLVSGDVDGRWLVLYPIAPNPDGGEEILINWITTRPIPGAGNRHNGDWRHSVDKQEVFDHFGDWRLDDVDVQGILRSAAQAHAYPMLDRDALPRWSFGPVTLLGDSAHPMYPMGSNGATQAIVDGRSLAYHLAHGADIRQALIAYEEERRPVTTEMQFRNRQQGPEVMITMANQRAPAGFSNIDDVIKPDELAAIASRYAQAAGFDPAMLRNRRSYDVAS
ncbi:flavin-dependent oxidoreductase [Lysobacter sp. K5869]|uniref:flavin-dependent oxidoreductase n=1 Tax=Lysobacter sp. K5869 TaxID=2820808 RepID=UPI001C05FC3A|nr:flavin-dependent oxidoreductase [Lysobacter sp. K5869]QWP75409.1 flavin-dependent oxidoreductase [Lysobacter sp. K5869]